MSLDCVQSSVYQSSNIAYNSSKRESSHSKILLKYF